MTSTHIVESPLIRRPATESAVRVPVSLAVGREAATFFYYVVVFFGREAADFLYDLVLETRFRRVFDNFETQNRIYKIWNLRNPTNADSM